MFNGIWLVATEPLTIQGRSIQTGERFHISRVHSGWLLVTGRATIAHPQPPPKSRTPEPEPPIATPRKRGRPRKSEQASTPLVQPEKQAENLAEPSATEPLIYGEHQRVYQRRDLEPE